MTAFTRCLPVILGFEGGFVDDPDDVGGATNRGITQRAYDQWRTQSKLPTQSVELCTPQETEAIYYLNYWEPAGCDRLMVGVDLVVFDSAVQHGVARAKQFLGEVGPSIDGLCARRSRYYTGIAAAHDTQLKFLHGWLNRVATLKAIATEWASEPPPALAA